VSISLVSVSLCSSYTLSLWVFFLFSFSLFLSGYARRGQGELPRATGRL